jgi:hypothetical protein
VSSSGIEASTHRAYHSGAFGTRGDADWRERTAERIREYEMPWACRTVLRARNFRKHGSRVPVLVGVAAMEGTNAVAFVLDVTEFK